MSAHRSPWRSVDPDLVARASVVAGLLRRDVADREARRDRGRTELALLREHDLVTVLDGTAARPGTWHDVLALVNVLAAEDASIAALVGYHYMTSQLAAAVAGPDQRDALREQARLNGWFWGGAVNPKGPLVHLTRDGDGWRLDGSKVFSTGAAVGDRIAVRAQVGDDVQFVALPADRAGIGYDTASWSHLGMALTESGTTTFDGVRVEPDELLGDPLPSSATVDASPAATLGTPLIQSMFAAVYLGAARGALADASRYVTTESRPFANSGVDHAAQDPYVLERAGRFEIAVRAGELLLVEAAHVLEDARARGGELTAAERGEAAVATYAAKAHATEAALEVTAGVFELQGARSAATSLGLDRRWRDVRTHTLHDPVAYKLREVGDYSLTGGFPAPDLEGYR